MDERIIKDSLAAILIEYQTIVSYFLDLQQKNGHLIKLHF